MPKTSYLRIEKGGTNFSRDRIFKIGNPSKYGFYKPVPVRPHSVEWWVAQDEIYKQQEEAKRRSEEEAKRREEETVEARERRLEFLQEAAAVPLPPITYARWLVEHLRAGGRVQRMEKEYPYLGAEAPIEYAVGQRWLLTNNQLEAADMPAGYGENKLQVFIDGSFETMRRQFIRAVGDRLGQKEPCRAEQGGVGPYFASGPSRAYGDSALNLFAFIAADKRGRPVPVPAYTNKPDEVVAYRNLLPTMRDFTWHDAFMVDRLDELSLTGMCRALEGQRPRLPATAI